MNYKDTVKVVADGPKVMRDAVFNSVGSDGYSVKIIVSGDKSGHPLKDITEAALFESGLYDLTVSGPKQKQTEITDYEYEDIWKRWMGIFAVDGYDNQEDVIWFFSRKGFF